MMDRGDFDRSDYEAPRDDRHSGDEAQLAQNAAPDIQVAPQGQAAPQAAPATPSANGAEPSKDAAKPGPFTVEKVDSYNSAAVVLEIPAEKGKKIVLPPDSQVEAVLVNGDDLILREADGSLIVIKGGLKQIETLVIGDIEIPADAMAASLQAGGVTLPAAGPSGPDGNALSSGGNFDFDPGSIGDPFAIRDLLGFTEFDRQFPDQREFDPLREEEAPDNPVSITDLTPEVDGGDVVVDEDDLLGSRGPGESDGSDPTKESATQGGSFTISAPDGVATLTLSINGTTVTVIQNGVLTNNPVTTSFGTLTVTGYDAATGQVTYEYTLKDNGPHPAGQDQNSIFENLAIVLTDPDGDTATGTLSVNIVDDVPDLAIVDADGGTDSTDSVAEGGLLDTGTWSLVTGADGVTPANFTISINGAAAVAVSLDTPIDTGKGILTIKADHTWTFQAANNLDNNTAQSISFTLSATDGDGDFTTDSHTITITDVAGQVLDATAALTVAERGLNDDGSDLPAGSTAETDASGTLQFKAGSDSLTVQFAALAGQPQPGAGFDPTEFGLPAGTPLTWAYGSGGTDKTVLIGSLDGVAKIQLSLGGDLSIAAGQTGNVTVTATLLDEMPHTFNGTTANNTFSITGLNVEAVDIDSPALTATVGVTVTDDVPNAKIAATGTSVTHDETAGIDVGSNDQNNAALPVALAGLGILIGWAQSAAAVVTTNGTVAGADGGSSALSLDVSAANVDSGLDTIAGKNILLVKEGNIIVGRVDTDGDNAVSGSDPAAFAITIDNNGVLSVAQYLAIKHPVTSNPDDALSIVTNAVQATVTVTDSEGDTSSQSVGIGNKIVFEDSGPSLIAPESATLINSVGSSGVFDLDVDANIDNNVGTDQSGTISFANITNGQQATGLINGTVTNLTSGGQNIQLFLVDHDANAATPMRLEGWTGGLNTGTKAFQVTLQPDGSLASSTDTYQVEIFTQISATQSTSVSNFSALGNNSQQYKALDVAGTTQDLLFSGYERTATGTSNITTGAAISASSTGVGVANNSMNDGDNLRIDFVNDATVTAGNNNAYNYSTHYNANSFQFGIVQVNGSPPPDSIEVWIRIYNADDQKSPQVGELTDDGQLNTINEIKVNGVSVNLAGLQTDGNGGYLVTGLDLNDTVQVTAAGGYNRIEIENARGINGANPSLNGEDFDIGAFAFVRTITNVPSVEMQFDLALKDADGDTVVSPLVIDLLSSTSTNDYSAAGVGQTQTAGAAVQNMIGSNFVDSLTGNGLDNVLVGLDGNDTLNGAGGNDLLIGGYGNDTLTGGIGNDFLRGGAGTDTLTGDGGIDTFYFDASAFGSTDSITDYVAGTDFVDLSDLFTVDTQSGKTLSQYVDLDTSGVNEKIVVDTSGSGNFDTATNPNAHVVAQTQASVASVSIIYDDNSSSGDHTGNVT